MQVKVTKRTVDALKPGERDLFLWDSELRGFGVKCTPKGRKVYVVQYQRGGRGNPTRRVTIGPHGPLTPDKARTEAERLLAETKLGKDPAAARTRQRREPTISELADRYVTEHVQTHNRPSTAKEVIRLVEKLIKPGLGRTRISALTRAQVKQWHYELRDRPISANRALAALSKMMSLATVDWELREDNPCIGVKKFAEEKRERFYSDDELRRIGETLAKSEADGTELPGCLNVIRLLAVTGMRLGEVLNLKWRDVDLEASAIRLSDAKTGARTVPLGTATLAMLSLMERTSEFVVHGPDPNSPLSRDTMESAWRRLRKRAEVPDGRLHDFRHTTGTYAAQAGFNAFMIRDLLGHKTVHMTGRYVERTADPIRAAADAVAGRVAAAMQGESSAEVVELPNRKA